MKQTIVNLIDCNPLINDCRSYAQKTGLSKTFIHPDSINKQLTQETQLNWPSHTSQKQQKFWCIKNLTGNCFILKIINIIVV